MVKVTLSFAASPPEDESEEEEDDEELEDEDPELELELELPESFLPEHAVRTRVSITTRDNIAVSHRFFDTVFLNPFHEYMVVCKHFQYTAPSLALFTHQTKGHPAKIKCLQKIPLQDPGRVSVFPPAPYCTGSVIRM